MTVGPCGPRICSATLPVRPMLLVHVIHVPRWQRAGAYLDQAWRVPSADGDMNVGPIADDMEQQLES